MKKIIFTLLVILLYTSCASVKPRVALRLSEVNGKSINGMSYIDDTIAIYWSYIYKAKLNFKLKNVAKSNIRIIWDNAAYVNASGSTDRIMHTGVKYINRNEFQPPSVVPSGSFVEDAIIPTSVVSYQPYIGWVEGDLFGVSSNPTVAKEQLKNTYGKSVKVVLPVEINGIVKDYNFLFNVTQLIK